MATNTSSYLSIAADVATAVTGIVALGVAYISLRLSSKSLGVQERHNRLSLKPIPFLALADYKHEIRAKVVNDGAGPLVIKTVKVRRGTVEKSDVISWMPELPTGIYWSNFTSLLANRAVLPNNELILVSLNGDPNDKDFCVFRDKCRTVLAELEVVLEYTDIYNELYEPYARKMDWFNRDKGTRDFNSKQKNK